MAKTPPGAGGKPYITGKTPPKGRANGKARQGAETTDLTVLPTPPMARKPGSGGLAGITGADTAWFGPLNPLPELVPHAAGRQWDYPVAYNIRIAPREERRTSFYELRGLADAYSLLRLAIETRKDQIVKMQWTIKPFEPDAKSDDRCDALEAFFKSPDKRHSWREWLRMLVEEILVTAAPCVYFHPNLGNKPYAFELMDGATIALKIDIFGRTPLPPQTAYQQVLKGIPAIDYIMPSNDPKYIKIPQLVYKAYNKRVWSPYGLSPVEQIIMIVNIGLRREISQLQFFTEGNIPEALISTPETWNAEQIKQFQIYWDSILEGNTGERRHAKFVPGGMQVHDTKTATLTDIFDEWLARVIQYCFSLPPTPYVKQINKGETENMKEQAEEEGLLPLMQYIEDFMNFIIATYWGYDDIGFSWVEEENIDPLVQAQTFDLYINNGTMLPEEVREKLGLDPFTAEQQAKIDTQNNMQHGLDGDGKPIPKPGIDGQKSPSAQAKAPKDKSVKKKSLQPWRWQM